MLIPDILAVTALALGAAILVPVTVVFVETVASFRKAYGVRTLSPERPRIAVVIPAHDESLTVAAAVRNVKSALSRNDRIVVVADNCQDNTATLARQAGAEVVERVDPHKRGKGYALDFGIQHLKSDPPDVVVIVDADCQLERDALQRIAGLVLDADRPVQARYEMLRRPASAGMYISLASLAFRIKNYVRPLGCARLGIPCQLMGTGMGFPWHIASHMNLATSEIVEDLVFGLDLARAGYPPIFCDEALVTSEFPVSREGQATQRARWETGHLNTIVRYVPALLIAAFQRRDIRLLGMVLDLAVPPLAFLAIIIGAFVLLALPIAVWSANVALFILVVAVVALFVSAVILAWLRAGRDLVSFLELVRAPGYVLSKLGLYCRIILGRKVAWIRSRREADEPKSDVG